MSFFQEGESTLAVSGMSRCEGGEPASFPPALSPPEVALQPPSRAPRPEGRLPSDGSHVRFESLNLRRSDTQ